MPGGPGKFLNRHTWINNCELLHRCGANSEPPTLSKASVPRIGERELGGLNQDARLPYIAGHIARNQSGENTKNADVAFHQREYERPRSRFSCAFGG